MELSIIINITSWLLLTGFFSAFPGLGSGIIILMIGSETIWTNYYPNGPLILMGCYIAGGLIRFLINKTERCNDAYPVLLVLFGSTTIISSVISINPIDALKNSCVLFLFLMISYIFHCNSRYQKRKKWMIRFILITGMLNCLLILVQTPWRVLLTNLLIEGWLPAIRMFYSHHSDAFHQVGGFTNPIISGLFLVLMIPLWFQLLYRIKIKSKIGIGNGLIIGAIAIIAISNLLIFSKTLWILTLIMILAGWVFYSYHDVILRFQNYIVPTIFVGTGCFILIIAIYYTIFGMGIGLENRMEKHLYSIYAFTQNPLFGIGYGQLNPYLAWKEMPFQFDDEQGYSSLILLLSETGLLGTVIFVLLMLYVLDLFQFESPNFLNHSGLGIYFVLWISILVFPIHQYLIFWCILGIVCGSQKPIYEPEPITQIPMVEYKVDQGH